MKKYTRFLKVAAVIIAVILLTSPVSVQAEKAKTSKNIVMTKIDEYDFIDFFSEGLAWVQKDDKWGIIDNKGNVVLKPQLKADCTYEFKDGKAKVKKNGDYYYVNKEGKKVAGPKNDESDTEAGSIYTGGFYEGLAKVESWVEVEVEKNDEFNIVFDTKFGFEDEEGNVVIAPRYDAAGDFSDGLAAVAFYEDGDELWGFINRKGKVVIEPVFVEVGEFHNGLVEVSDGRKYGIVNIKGEYVVDLKYDDIYYNEDGVWIAHRKNKKTKKESWYMVTIK